MAETFMRSQIREAIFATKFNKQLDNKRVSKDIPRIEFLPCFIYERRLHPNNYVKWNDDDND